MGSFFGSGISCTVKLAGSLRDINIQIVNIWVKNICISTGRTFLMTKILVTMPFNEKHKKYIEEIGKNCSFTYKKNSEVREEDLKDTDIIFGNVSPKLLPKAEKLQWIQLNSAGAAEFCTPGVLKEDTILTNASGAYDISVSDWMLTATYMLARKMDLYMDNQRKHVWQEMGSVCTVTGSTVLVLGLGNIGKCYAAKVKALGAYVIGVTKHQHKEIPACADEMHTMEKLPELLPRADFVVMVLPGTEENKYVIGTRELKLMKPTAYLINAGRGNAVNNMELNQALREGVIAGAALDVTDPEPLPEDHPLWDAPRCIVCPHISGKFYLAETFERIVRITGENLEKYLAGDKKDMINQVKRELGY